MPIDIEEIQKIVRRQLGARTAGPDAHLQSDLGAESLDLQAIITALEDRFDVSLDDEELERIETVRDLHTLLTNKI